MQISLFLLTNNWSVDRSVGVLIIMLSCFIEYLSNCYAIPNVLSQISPIKLFISYLSQYAVATQWTGRRFLCDFSKWLFFCIQQLTYPWIASALSGFKADISRGFIFDSVPRLALDLWKKTVVIQFLLILLYFYVSAPFKNSKFHVWQIPDKLQETLLLSTDQFGHKNKCVLNLANVSKFSGSGLKAVVHAFLYEHIQMYF